MSGGITTVAIDRAPFATQQHPYALVDSLDLVDPSKQLGSSSCSQACRTLLVGLAPPSNAVPHTVIQVRRPPVLAPGTGTTIATTAIAETATGIGTVIATVIATEDAMKMIAT